MGPVISLFWTSGDVCNEFLSQDILLLACVLPQMHAIDFPDSPLVRHLLTS